jgi:hypothetical protein
MKPVRFNVKNRPGVRALIAGGVSENAEDNCHGNDARHWNCDVSFDVARTSSVERAVKNAEFSPATLCARLVLGL